MEKVLILSMSTDHPVIESRRDAVLETYYKMIDQYENIDMLFYSETENLEKSTIKAEADYLYKYSDNEIKHIAIFNEIKKRYYGKYDWYFFIDTDTFVNIPLLAKIISTFDKDYMHGMNLGMSFDNITYLSGGAGYLISNELIPKLFEMKNYNTGFADMTLALNAKDRGIKLKHDPRFYASNPWRDKVLNPEDILKKEIHNMLTYHYVQESKMHILYNLIK